jgi:sugar phosphate isomerase/epimerase
VNPTVALQLYTVRDETQKDFLGTLRAVARMGYPAVQLAGNGGLSAADLKHALDDLGLKVAGAHLSMEALESNLQGEVEFCLALGTPDVVLSALPQDLRVSQATYADAARRMALIGERSRGLGARFSYHNHAFEFVRFGDQYGLDILLDAQRPADVLFEPDVYWISKGGEDPADFVRKYAGRIPLVHLKDMAADAEGSFAEVGEGVLDWTAIFAAAEAGGAEWYIVEQDRWTRPSLEAAALSLRHLREWGKL